MGHGAAPLFNILILNYMIVLKAIISTVIRIRDCLEENWGIIIGLFGKKNSKPQNSEAYNAADQVLEQNIAFCEIVIDHIDGSSSKEREMISEAREQLSNMKGLQNQLRSGQIEPEMMIMLGLGSAFFLQLNIVNTLDASTPKERELVYLAKNQLRGALQAGYAPAVDLYQKEQLPI